VYLGGCLSGPASCVRIREIAMGGLTCGGWEADGKQRSKGYRTSEHDSPLGPSIQSAIPRASSYTCPVSWLGSGKRRV
jgi:hypothetical protein